MACSEDETLKSEQMAQSVNTNAVVIRRILCALARGELVLSQTGSTGGSRLARRPEDITLLDVYRVVECPRVFSLHHRRPSRCCPVGAGIGEVLEDVRREMDLALEHVLGRITIEDVVMRLN
jgi:DNA-binding IscR family transcriptional regulator